MSDAAQSASGKNPYKVGSLFIIGSGLLIAGYGFATYKEAEIRLGAPGTPPSVEKKRNTGIGVAGLGIAAAGVALYVVGEKKANRVQPLISFGPDLKAIGGQVRW